METCRICQISGSLLVVELNNGHRVVVCRTCKEEHYPEDVESRPLFSGADVGSDAHFGYCVNEYDNRERG